MHTTMGGGREDENGGYSELWCQQNKEFIYLQQTQNSLGKELACFSSVITSQFVSLN